MWMASKCSSGLKIKYREPRWMPPREDDVAAGETFHLVCASPSVTAYLRDHCLRAGGGGVLLWPVLALAQRNRCGLSHHKLCQILSAAHHFYTHMENPGGEANLRCWATAMETHTRYMTRESIDYAANKRCRIIQP